MGQDVSCDTPWRRCWGAIAPGGVRCRAISQVLFPEVPTYPLRRVALHNGRECGRALPHPADIGEQGEIIMDLKHYVEGLEAPDLKEIASNAKQDILPAHLQSQFRSAASKVNVLAATVRPDFTYAAKYLTTRYGKATKSDMTQVVKLIRRAKEESTEIIFPNIFLRSGF